MGYRQVFFVKRLIFKNSNSDKVYDSFISLLLKEDINPRESSGIQIPL